MMIRLKERALPVAVIAATVGVIAFTVLQYRWSTEVIEATGVRLADTLQLSMANWQVDFERNFSEVTTTLRPEPGPATPDTLAVLEGRLVRVAPERALPESRVDDPHRARPMPPARRVGGSSHACRPSCSRSRRSRSWSSRLGSR